MSSGPAWHVPGTPARTKPSVWAPVLSAISTALALAWSIWLGVDALLVLQASASNAEPAAGGLFAPLVLLMSLAYAATAFLTTLLTLASYATGRRGTTVAALVSHLPFAVLTGAFGVLLLFAAAPGWSVAAALQLVLHVATAVLLQPGLRHRHA